MRPQSFCAFPKANNHFCMYSSKKNATDKKGILPFLSVTPFRIITIVLLFDTVCLRYTAEKVTNTQGDFRFYIFSNQSIFLSLCRIQSFHFIFKNVSNIQSSSNKVSNTRSFSKKISCSRSYPKNVYNLWSFLNKVLNDNSQS